MNDTELQEQKSQEIANRMRFNSELARAHRFYLTAESRFAGNPQENPS